MQIYLDYNIFAYLHDKTNPALSAKIAALQHRHHFPYSPGHIEEVATALMNPSKLDPVDRLVMAYAKLESISRVSRNLEWLPSQEGAAILKVEEPIECFRRVVDKYNGNRIIEPRERQMLERFKESDADGSIANEVSNLPPEFLLKDEHRHYIERQLYFDTYYGLTAKRLGVRSIAWPDIAPHYVLRERAIELAMNHLEEIRFRPESVKKFRSRIHDVTHSIYASLCDQFVTHDERFYDKVRAVYTYFGISTEVLLMSEFLARDYP